MPTYNLPLPEKITANAKKRTFYRTLQVAFGDGYSQQALDGINSKVDTWKLMYAPLEEPDKTTVETFFDTVNTTQWFYWTPIGETVPKKWLIKKDSVRYNFISCTKLEISFEIVQTFQF